MAMVAKEVKEWIATIGDGDMMAIDDGGLTIVVKGQRSYCEIGGIPLKEGTEELEDGWESFMELRPVGKKKDEQGELIAKIHAGQ